MSKNLVVLFLGAFLLAFGSGIDAFAACTGGTEACSASGNRACNVTDVAVCSNGTCKSTEECNTCVCKVVLDACGCATK